MVSGWCLLSLPPLPQPGLGGAAQDPGTILAGRLWAISASLSADKVLVRDRHVAMPGTLLGLVRWMAALQEEKGGFAPMGCWQRAMYPQLLAAGHPAGWSPRGQAWAPDTLV